MSVLYLDFDGVLHPSDVYLIDGLPVLQGDQEHLGLFCWVHPLEILLAEFPEVEIRLSTSWVDRVSFEYAKEQLPATLQARVTGATWESRTERYDHMTRYEQILADAEAHGIRDWVAIDDNDFGWPDAERKRLVRTYGNRGISDPVAQGDLYARLKWITGRVET